MFKGRKILFVGPHVDDIEFGCGGIIGTAVGVGEVYFLTLSFSEKSLLKGFTRQDIEGEMLNSAKTLGVKNIANKEYPTRDFPAHRQAILEDLILAKKAICPDIIFAPSTFDTHQDHKVVHEECFRCFKDRTIFGYEAPFNNRSFTPHLYHKLDENSIQAKLSAISCYKSQLAKKEGIIDAVKALSILRGAQIGAKYAEAFEAIRIIE